MPFQVNCSELIADFKLHDDEQMRRILKSLVRNYGVRLHFQFESLLSNNELLNELDWPETVEVEGVTFKLVESKREPERVRWLWKLIPATAEDTIEVVKTIYSKECLYFCLEDTIPTSTIVEQALLKLLNSQPSERMEEFWSEFEMHGLEGLLEPAVKLSTARGDLITLCYAEPEYSKTLGWHFDCQPFNGLPCEFPFLELAESRYRAEVVAYSGGHLDRYEEYLKNSDRKSLTPIRQFVISVNPSSACEQEPRCSYCYLKDKSDIPFPELFAKFKELCAEHSPTTITFGYNRGYPQAQMAALLEHAAAYCEVAVTARPEEVERLFSFGEPYIDYLALSYDTGTEDFSSLQRLKELLPARVKIGLNYLLLTPIKLERIRMIFKDWGSCFDQFHFLVPKKLPLKLNLEEELDKIALLKMFSPAKVFIDECLKMIQSGESCRRGKELITLQPDGSVRLCSFAETDDSEDELTNCPYLY